MSKGPTETTDRMFPPPENPNPDAPVPLGPSIRVQFQQHREGVSGTLAAYEKRLGAVEAKVTPAHPQSVLGAVKGGVIKAGKVTPILLLVGEVVAQVASLLGKTDWVGPIRFITSLFGG